MQETKIKFEIRTKLGLSQSDFCEKYKISRATVSGWANNKRPISPRHVVLLKDLGISQDAIEKPGEKLILKEA